VRDLRQLPGVQDVGLLDEELLHRLMVFGLHHGGQRLDAVGDDPGVCRRDRTAGLRGRDRLELWRERLAGQSERGPMLAAASTRPIASVGLIRRA